MGRLHRGIGNSQCTHKDVRGTGGNYAEDRKLFRSRTVLSVSRPQQAVDHLVNGPVAAKDHDGVKIGACHSAHDLLRMPRVMGELHAHVSAFDVAKQRNDLPEQGIALRSRVRI